MGLVRFESKRHKTGESSGLILELTQLAQVISTMCQRFDVSVKHRAGAAAAHGVPGAMDIEPFGSGFLAPANLVTHDWIENLGATSSDRTKSGCPQSFQRIANGHSKDSLSQMSNLDRGKCLDVQLRVERAESPQEIEIPIFVQGGMQAAYHVYFGDAQRKRVRHGTHDFLNSVFKGVRVALPGCKRAELAG